MDITEAIRRKFIDVWICYNCGKKVRGKPEKCPKCGYKRFRKRKIKKR
jgi:rubrerythrin